ncbi:Hsp20/alpha crystallin family protein [Desulfococcaceae bacterium HSG8]|nr:Hsp20/alpha crystallin family protein [Desulfococcaceae bacterium HSG8]
MIMRSMFDPLRGWRSPFGEAERMRRQLRHFSDELEKGLTRGRWSGVFPLINVTEDSDNYFVRAELPGLATEEPDISVTANGLAIAGERNLPDESREAKYHRKERESGRFSRMVTLPGHIDPSKTEAKLTDGVLTVTLPKAASSKPRQIKVS